MEITGGVLAGSVWYWQSPLKNGNLNWGIASMKMSWECQQLARFHAGSAIPGEVGLGCIPKEAEQNPGSKSVFLCSCLCSCLSSWHNFSQWWTVIRKCKPRKKVAFGQGVYHSNREANLDRRLPTHLNLKLSYDSVLPLWGTS